MKRDHQDSSFSSGGKAKMWADEDAAVDKLFAMLGYNVKSSDMDEVAQKIEQLEEVMGSVRSSDGTLSQLADDSVHYNPSDLSSWLQSMISGLNPDEPNNSTSSSSVNQMLVDSDFGSDLIAIPGKAVYPTAPQPPQAKKLKTEPFLDSAPPSFPVFAPAESTRKMLSFPLTRNLETTNTPLREKKEKLIFPRNYVEEGGKEFTSKKVARSLGLWNYVKESYLLQLMCFLGFICIHLQIAIYLQLSAQSWFEYLPYSSGDKANVEAASF